MNSPRINGISDLLKMFSYGKISEICLLATFMFLCMQEARMLHRAPTPRTENYFL